MFNKKQQKAVQTLREIDYHLSVISNHSISFKQSQKAWDTIMIMQKEIIPLLEQLEYKK